MSAVTGEGIPALLAAVEELLRSGMERLDLLVPYAETLLTHEVRTQGIVLSEHAEDDGMRLDAYVPPRLAGRLRSAGAVTGS